MRAICLAALSLAAAHAADIEGVVLDATHSPVSGASLTVESPNRTQLAVVRTDASGSFALRAIPTGTYSFRVDAQGFEPVEMVFGVGVGSPLPAEIELSPARVYSAVTVTSTRGAIEDANEATQLVIVDDRSDYLRRPLPTIGQALEHQPGILVQQTTYGQVSPILRGLTGYQVLNLVDGIRYNNSTFRNGPNQYLAYIEPSSSRRVEAVLGPSSAEFGSDSLGGSINVLTVSPVLPDTRRRAVHGQFSIFSGTADASAGSNAQFDVGTARLGWLVGGSGKRNSDLRAGDGEDSRNVFSRMFGLSPGFVKVLIGGRQQDTGFSQYGVNTKLIFRPSADQSFSLWYQHGVLHGVRGYRDLLGGSGRLQSTFDPQDLHFFYGRYEKLQVGPLDSISATFSINAQRDGQITQRLHNTDPIDTDRNGVEAYGYSVQGTTHASRLAAIAFGADFYDERIDSTRTRLNPATSAVSSRRPLYPDNSTYRTLGLFGQSSMNLIRERLTLRLGGRYTRVHFKSPQNPEFQALASSRTFDDLTFNASLSLRLNERASLYALSGRGFRAPNVNDLGALGLNSLGFEVPAEEAISFGALLSTSAGENAVSKGRPLSSLKAETLYQYEVGFRYSTGRVQSRIQIYDSELYDPIVRRTLLFPVDSLPATLGGLPTIPIQQTQEQLAQGVASVGNASDPRAVKAFVNDGRTRYYGGEAMLHYALTAKWRLSANYSSILGRDLFPNRPVRRLPPQMGYAEVRYSPAHRGAWASLGLQFAASQNRLSGGDISDVRIGAARSRDDIASFFHGTRAHAYLDPSGTVFRPTGETLAEIQDRLLRLGTTVNGVSVANSGVPVPLFTQTNGWATLSLHAGIPFTERLNMDLALENMLDANYRSHGSGTDAAGINAYLGLRYIF